MTSFCVETRTIFNSYLLIRKLKLDQLRLRKNKTNLHLKLVCQFHQIRFFWIVGIRILEGFRGQYIYTGSTFAIYITKKFRVFGATIVKTCQSRLEPCDSPVKQIYCIRRLIACRLQLISVLCSIGRHIRL